VFLSGDAGVCAMVKTVDPAIHTVATFEGVGDSTISMHPARARELIREGVAAALNDDAALAAPTLDTRFEVVIRFARDEDAYWASFYPGARLIDAHDVGFDAEDFNDVMVFLTFVTPPASD